MLATLSEQQATTFRVRTVDGASSGSHSLAYMAWPCNVSKFVFVLLPARRVVLLANTFAALGTCFSPALEHLTSFHMLKHN